MAEYHVGCGICDIYAGTLNKKGTMWKNKSPVTNETICAVVEYMMLNLKDGCNSTGYGFTTRDGKKVRLSLTVIDAERKEA